ncbi:hypothetical protein HID58_093704 [Brassica napus]|uniref:Uncharacterized protein n=1 Tax=Brassica napus TaxID=3708 RepID=A0ABQ7XAF7_BRANA|nr:hypothetical protein HID58_093704 [Brassica napus]
MVIALALSVCRSSCLWFERWMFCAMGFKISTGMVKGAHLSPLSKEIGRRKAASSSITSVLYLKDEITIAGAPDRVLLLHTAYNNCPEILDVRKLKAPFAQASPLSLGDVVPWEQIKPSKNILQWLQTRKDFVEIRLKSTMIPSVSLSQVLLHYYPLDGRLTISPVGKLTVNYTEDGVVFLEAETNCKMDEIGDITKPDLETLEKLVYDVVETKNILEVPPVTAQVTKWRVCSSTLYESLYVRWYRSYGVR